MSLMTIVASLILGAIVAVAEHCGGTLHCGATFDAPEGLHLLQQSSRIERPVSRTEAPIPEDVSTPIDEIKKAIPWSHGVAADDDDDDTPSDGTKKKWKGTFNTKEPDGDPGVQGDAFKSDNLTAFGSHFKPSGKRPHIVIGMGVPKAGSTYMFAVLNNHEDYIRGVAKELRYFAGENESACINGSRAEEYINGSLNNFQKGPAELYIHSCFWKDWEPGKMLLEFSPGYLTHPMMKLVRIFKAIQEVEQHADVRFLTVLRDPVQRAQSEWNMRRQNGGDLSKLEDGALEDFLAGVATNNDSAVTAGEYDWHLSKMLEFFPKEQMLVVNTQSLDDRRTWGRIFSHIGMPHHPTKTKLSKMMENAANKSNSAQVRDGPGAMAKYVKISMPVRKTLHAHYAEHDTNLWKLLGVDPWW